MIAAMSGGTCLPAGCENLKAKRHLSRHWIWMMQLGIGLVQRDKTIMKTGNLQEI